MIKNTNKKRGYTLLEILFYIAIFAVLAPALTNALIVMTKSFQETSIEEEFVQSSSIMERISREIRQATSIDASSTATDLKLKDSTGADKTEFKLNGSQLQLLEGPTLVSTGYLNIPDINITSVSFTKITTANGLAVSVSLSFKSSKDVLNRVQSFQDTVVLRGAY